MSNALSATSVARLSEIARVRELLQRDLTDCDLVMVQRRDPYTNDYIQLRFNEDTHQFFERQFFGRFAVSGSTDVDYTYALTERFGAALFFEQVQNTYPRMATTLMEAAHTFIPREEQFDTEGWLRTQCQFYGVDNLADVYCDAFPLVSGHWSEPEPVVEAEPELPSFPYIKFHHRYHVPSCREIQTGLKEVMRPVTATEMLADTTTRRCVCLALGSL